MRARSGGAAHRPNAARAPRLLQHGSNPNPSPNPNPNSNPNPNPNPNPNQDHEREAPPPVGAVVTVSYFELTNAGVPRFPAYERVRPDVPASDFTLT